MRTLAALLAALALTAASPAAAATRLVWRVPKGGGYRVLLPSNWRFQDASYPSDHATHLWYDPQNPLRKLEVTLSGCVGCVETDFDPHRPDPRGELPQSVLSTYWISPWKLAFSAFSDDDPYPENGVVQVLSQQGDVIGSDITELWLPQSQHSLATRILNSFSPRRA